MTKNIAIKVNNLTKSYKLYSKPIERLKESLNLFGKKYHADFDAVKNISFEINQGETVGIIGRNGCGKSTLLKMIANVLTPTNGRVIVRGHISAILELGTGFNPELTGHENIYLNTSINGFSKKQTDQKFDEIVEFSELGEFIHQAIKTYSSGMKARLAFSVAINVAPDILIVDEALSVGDAAFQRKCFAKMEELRSNGTTVLFVSHSEGSIVNLCNRAIWISNGELIIDGVPKLITGLYHKYSNLNQVNKERVLYEYQMLANKNEFLEEQNEEVIKKNATLKDKKESSISSEETYSPDLKSISTIYYEENGAKIYGFEICTLSGKKVNILLQGREYIYSYNVLFTDKQKKKVIFGLSIVNKQGVMLAGGNYPAKNQYQEILENKVKIQWNFKCNLLEGDYFLTAGVMDESGVFLARIKDAYMIKVKNNNESAQMLGVVDLNLKGSLTRC